jgi:PPM family protein phosphatase
MVEIEASGSTDVGRKRKGNEDSFFVDEEIQLYVVADGMGGHAAGEVASRLVVDTLQKFVSRFRSDPAGGELPKVKKNLTDEANLLLNAIHFANQAVHQAAKKKISYQGMGSTVSAVYMAGKTLIAANVGDSPIYLVRNESIETLSTPHTMMAEYEGMATKGSKKLGDQFRHVLTRGMGLKEKVEPDVCETDLSGDEVAVICSDGLSDKISPEEILEVVTYERPERAGKTLIRMANDRGGDDNITVIVLRVVDLEGAPPEKKPAADTPRSGKKPAVSVGPITVDYDTDDASHSGVVTGIDPDGVSLETSDAIAVGEDLLLTITPGGGRSSVTVSGTVEHRTPEGIRVKFRNLSREHRAIIASLEKG